VSRASWPNETLPSHAVVLSYPQPGTTVCTVTGRIDTDTTPALRDALATAVHDENPHLVIDLSAVTVLDSIGLHALFVASHQHDTNCDGHLAAVVDSNSRTFPHFYAAALKMIFDLHDDLASALQVCATAGTDRPLTLRHRSRPEHGGLRLTHHRGDPVVRIPGSSPGCAPDPS
jgi:anti-anti-sigma factor